MAMKQMCCFDGKQQVKPGLNNSFNIYCYSIICPQATTNLKELKGENS